MSAAIGGPPVAHGHSASVNGQNTTMPAIPAVNGGSLQSDHGRKPSMTITPAGATGYAANGGAVGGPQSKPNNIQFGSLGAGSSPALGTPPTLAHQSSNLSVSFINPRLASPQNSPSPIPQPATASGGKPPAALQGPGNGFSFGQFVEGDPNNMMRAQMPIGPSQDQMRRGSSQSMHSDVGMPSGRGGFGPRGRGGYQQLQPPMSHSPNQSFRTANSGRGVPQNFYPQGRQQGPYPSSPSMGTRTPASMNQNASGTPQMNQMHMLPGMPAQAGGYPYMGPHHQVNNHPVLPSERGKSSKPTRGPSVRGRGRGDRGDRVIRRAPGRGRGVHKDGFIPRNDPASEHYEPRRPVQQPPPRPQAPLSQPPIPPFPIQDLSPESGNFEHFLTQRHQGFITQPDPSIQAMYTQNYNMMMNQHQQMQSQYPGYLPPQSPRPPYQPQATYMQQTYSGPGQPPQNMSRQSSQMSVPDRPGSSVGHTTAQAPSMTSVATPSHPTTRTPSVSAAAKSFTLPTKRSAAIVIKNQQGEVLDFTKQAQSPVAAPSSTIAPAATPVPSVPTPPSRTASASEIVHTRTESVSTKTKEEKAKEMQEAIARKVADDKAKAKKEQEDAEQKRQESETKPVEEEPVGDKAADAPLDTPDEITVEDQEPIPATENDTSITVTASESVKSETEEPNAEKPVEDEEDEFERMAREMEEEEAARADEEARQEAEYAQRKAAKEEAQRKKEKDEEEAWLVNLKQSEREAEEREDALAKKAAAEAEGASDEESVSKMLEKSKIQDEPTPPSAESPSTQTPAESGTATPVSDISMPPPARSTGAAKRSKITDLTLNITKAIEPPEPSATLKSLQTARLLKDPSAVEYPTGITSPAPSTAERKFRYDRAFLLQFQDIFKEKPSVDWDQKIREAIGDGESATPGRPSASARTPSGMGGRNPSSRPAAPNAFSMGQFGQPARAGPTVLPPGTTSEQRFAMSNAMATGRSPMAGNPFASGRPMGVAVGAQMSRNASSSGLSMGPSPRMGGPSRGGSRAESKRTKHGAKQTADENNKMPLTAGLDVGSLQVSSTGWKPRSVGQSLVAGPALGGEGHMAPDVVQRKVKSNLNKMTPEKFDRIADQILEIAAQSKDETDGRTLRQVIQLTFEKATDEAHWASMYAMFCKRMLESMSAEIKDESIKDKNGNVVTGGALFRKYLLNRCQEEFEKGWKVNLPTRKEGESEEAVMLSEEYYIAAAAKRRGLGLVKFIGELFKLGMLTERIMHECVKKLLDYEGVPDEAEVESLTSLLQTVGANLDNLDSKAQPRMDMYFERIRVIMDMPDLPSRLRYMLMDVRDLRKAGWHSKNDDKGPKTIEQIHAEAAAAQQAAEMQRLAQQANRGGGRMGLGRGDARNFSGGYGQMPPPDNSNRVGTDDLRRLNQRTARQASTPAGLGPPSLSSGRTNSGRRGLGPGSSLLARAEDSGTSSRTGTPPALKDDKKKDESSVNAFSALAALEGQEGPASPPSNASSPPTQKSQPIERERSRSPEKKE